MGDIRKQKRKFKRPKQKYNKGRIEEENKIVEKYGLKNKKSIWKVESEVSKIRRRAKGLIKSSEQEKKEFFQKLNKNGFNVKNIADVLALTKEDILERRLQTIVFKKKLVNTIKEARQKIVHKQFLVNGKIVNKPGFFITKEFEDKIKLKPGREKIRKTEILEEENDKE